MERILRTKDKAETWCALEVGLHNTKTAKKCLRFFYCLQQLNKTPIFEYEEE